MSVHVASLILREGKATDPVVTTISSASCPPLLTINSSVSMVSVAPNGTIATKFNVKMATGVRSKYLTAKPAGTAGSSRIISQIAKGAAFALTPSLLIIVRNTSKSLVTQDLDSTEERLAKSKRCLAWGMIQRRGSIFGLSPGTNRDDCLFAGLVDG